MAVQKYYILFSNLDNFCSQYVRKVSCYSFNFPDVKVDKKHPELATRYRNTLQSLTVQFSALEVLLHQEAILNVLEVAQAFQTALEKPPSDKPVEQSLARRLSHASSASLASLSAAAKKVEQRRGKLICFQCQFLTGVPTLTLTWLIYP